MDWDGSYAETIFVLPSVRFPVCCFRLLKRIDLLQLLTFVYQDGKIKSRLHDVIANDCSSWGM